MSSRRQMRGVRQVRPACWAVAVRGRPVSDKCRPAGWAALGSSFSAWYPPQDPSVRSRERQRLPFIAEGAPSLSISFPSLCRSARWLLTGWVCCGQAPTTPCTCRRFLGRGWSDCVSAGAGCMVRGVCHFLRQSKLFCKVEETS